MATTIPSSSSSNKTAKSTLVNGMLFWTEAVKFYAGIISIIILSLFLGFSLGTIVAKRSFDQAAITSGHAQFNPTSGNIEWKNRCNG